MKNVSPRTASMLCYVPFVGWIAALVFLASQKFRGTMQVRFHSFQGLYMALLWFLIDLALFPFMGWTGWAVRKAMSSTVRLAVLVGWIYMFVKTSNDETVRLPFMGDLAERSAAEQAPERV